MPSEFHVRYHETVSSGKYPIFVIMEPAVVFPECSKKKYLHISSQSQPKV
jgi:hypothetical protein